MDQGQDVKQRTVLPTKPREQLVTRNPHHRHINRKLIRLYGKNDPPCTARSGLSTDDSPAKVTGGYGAPACLLPMNSATEKRGCVTLQSFPVFASHR